MSEEIYQAIKEQEQKEAPIQEANDKGEFDKQEWAKNKKAERDAVYELVNETATRIQNDPEALQGYLDVMARFPKGTPTNTLLIFAQRPDATRIADYGTWKGRHEYVKDFDNPIHLFKAGDEYTRDDGSIGTHFNVVHFYDESQTKARHIEPRYPAPVELLRSLINTSPVPIKAVESIAEARQGAYYDAVKGEIYVSEGLGETELFRELVIESAHAEIALSGDNLLRDNNNEAAHLTAYVLARRYGVRDAAVMPLVEKAAEDKPLTETKAELARIRNVSKAITDRMDAELEKSRPKKNAQRQVERGDRNGR